MSRRSALKLALTLGSVAVLAYNVTNSQAAVAHARHNAEKTRTNQSVTLTLYTSGDVNVQNLWQNELIPLYTKSHPNIHFNIVYSAHGVNDQATQARIAAAVQSGRNSGFDIVDAGFVSALSQTNALQKLSTKEVPLLNHIDKDLLLQSNYEGLPYRASSVVLAYNSDFVKNPPRTLPQLLAWIKAHPGKFTYNSPNTGGSGDSFVQNVVRSEMPASKRVFMTNGAAKNLERYWKPGLDTLRSLNPYIYRHGFYPNGNMAVLQLLANQSIWMAPVWSDMALSALAQHQLPPSIKLIQLTPAFNGGPACLGVVANSPHEKEADNFLNWLLTPTAQTIIVNQMHGYPGVEWKYMPASVRKSFAAIAGRFQPGFSSFYSNDLHQLWQAEVAAQMSN